MMKHSQGELYTNWYPSWWRYKSEVYTTAHQHKIAFMLQNSPQIDLLHYLHFYLQKATIMASRAFSSSARQLKQLNWTLHGTTIDVSWLIQKIERSVNEIPGLRARIVSAQVIQGTCITPLWIEAWVQLIWIRADLAARGEHSRYGQCFIIHSTLLTENIRNEVIASVNLY